MKNGEECLSRKRPKTSFGWWGIRSDPTPSHVVDSVWCYLSKKSCLILITICLPTTLHSSVNLGTDNVAVAFSSQ